jgi:hypothetical protein
VKYIDGRRKLYGEGSKRARKQQNILGKQGGGYITSSRIDLPPGVRAKRAAPLFIMCHHTRGKTSIIHSALNFLIDTVLFAFFYLHGLRTLSTVDLYATPVLLVSNLYILTCIFPLVHYTDRLNHCRSVDIRQNQSFGIILGAEPSISCSALPRLLTQRRSA